MRRVSSLDPTITPLLNFTVRSFLIRRWRPLLAKHHPMAFRRVVDVGTLHRLNSGAFDFPKVPFRKVRKDHLFSLATSSEAPDGLIALPRPLEL